jgi:putative effector of murein hydrolase
MHFLEKLFNWMLVIGLVLMVGRIVTAILMFLDIPFTSFFKDYSVISFIILIVGAIGSHVMKDQNKN